MTTAQGPKTTLDFLHEIVRELQKQYGKYPAGEKIRYEVYLGEDDSEDDNVIDEYYSRLEAIKQLKEEGIILDYVVTEKYEDFMHNEFAGTRINYKIAKCLLDKNKFKQHLAELNPPRETQKQVRDLSEEEEKINKQTWEVLQDIREQWLVTPKNKPVKYRIPNIVGGGAIPKQRREDILYKLEEQGAFEIQKGSNGARLTNPSRTAFYLIINPAKFDETYEAHRPKVISVNSDEVLDYTDNALRQEYEKKWEVIKVLKSNLVAKEYPTNLMIWTQAFIKGEVKTLGDAASYFAVFQQAGCFRKYGLANEGKYYVFVDVNKEQLLDSHRIVEQHYNRFSDAYKKKHPPIPPTPFDWKTLSRKNLLLAQKVVEITLNTFELQPFNRLVPANKIQLSKFESEQIHLDDVNNVLNKVEGIKVANEVLRQLIRAVGSPKVQTDYLPPEQDLSRFVFLQINSLDGLRQVKYEIDEHLQSKTSQSAETSNIEEVKVQRNIKSSDDILTVKTKAGLLKFNPNTGFVKLGNYQPQEHLNPVSQEAKALHKLMTAKEYTATYIVFLGEGYTKSKIRELGFVIRNLKNILGVLPKKTAQNKNCIKNVRGHGYRIII